MRSLRVLATVLLVCLSAHLALAQSGTTSVGGTIWDPNGLRVSGAEIRLTNEAIGFSKSAQTGEDGSYQFVQLTPGSYKLTVAKEGFRTSGISLDLMIHVPTTADVALKVGPRAETVQVTASLVTIPTTDASLGNAFDSNQIQNLPFEGRNVVEVLSLQPGVVYLGTNADPNTDSRSGSVNGGRSDQSNITLDGVDNNDQVNGYAFTGALRSTLDSVEEFRVTTTNSNADQGRSSGAQVALITRSGTNNLHGSAYFYYRPTGTSANDWFNKYAEQTSGEPNKPAYLDRKTFGGAIGGPIVKNKLFYFFNYEGQRTNEQTTVTRTVPSDTIRQGIIQYQCAPITDANGNIITPADQVCPGGSQQIQGIDPSALPTLSPKMYTVNVQPAYTALGTPQFASMDPNCSTQSNPTCPNGPGANAAVLQVFNKYPHANGTLTSDGLNSGSYTFASPLPANLNTLIGKIDYNVTQNQHLFVRGNLQDDSISAAEQFPGQPASSSSRFNTKGLAVGYTWTVRNNLINNFRYGYIRPSVSSIGSATQSFVSFRGLDDLNPIVYNQKSQISVNNFVDDLTWVKGKNTFQFGGNLRLIHNDFQNTNLSYYSAFTNVSWLAPSGIANFGTSLDPAAFGFPAVDPNYSSTYDNSAVALAGLVSQATANYNYQLAQNSNNISVLPYGAYVNRKYYSFEVEYYLQDTIRLTPSLTLTLGLRQTFLQPPYEANGQQVSPTTSIHEWYIARGNAAANGQSYSPALVFDRSGQANGKPPYWAWDYANIAPRFALAWAPGGQNGLLGAVFGSKGQTTVRLGYGIYYDHFGQGVVESFDRLGSFGLSSNLTIASNTQTVDGTPRFTGLNDIPASLLPSAPTPSYPFVPPSTGNSAFQSTWGLDDKLKTPYAHGFDFSWAREFKGDWVLELSYVGRLGRRLLQQLDFAMPTNLRDPQSGTTYFQAAQQFAQLARQGTPVSAIPPTPYWEDLFASAAGPASAQLTSCANIPQTPTGQPLTGNVSASQAMYSSFACNLGNETNALFNADLFCFPACANGNVFTYFNPQYSSLYGWSSIGTSSYNAGQVTLRHRMSHGLQLDFNYTYSKSIDWGSDAERFSVTAGQGTSFPIINTWFPKQMIAVSDYDTTHAFNANWIYQLPFGKGKAFASNANRLEDAVIGGWQFSGLFRITSGLPFYTINGLGNWATNWYENGHGVQIAPVHTGVYYNSLGAPQAFADPQSVAQNDYRHAYPGESGVRNNMRGPGYFGIDVGLSKVFQVTERQSVKINWEIFNLTNSVRFDPASITPALNDSAFGIYNNTLTKARVMQFALRYSF